jgi:hypothetical protein
LDENSKVIENEVEQLKTKHNIKSRVDGGRQLAQSELQNQTFNEMSAETSNRTKMVFSQEMKQVPIHYNKPRFPLTPSPLKDIPNQNQLDDITNSVSTLHNVKFKGKVIQQLKKHNPTDTPEEIMYPVDFTNHTTSPFQNSQPQEYGRTKSDLSHLPEIGKSRKKKMQKEKIKKSPANQTFVLTTGKMSPICSVEVKRSVSPSPMSGRALSPMDVEDRRSRSSQRKRKTPSVLSSFASRSSRHSRTSSLTTPVVL